MAVTFDAGSFNIGFLEQTSHTQARSAIGITCMHSVFCIANMKFVSMLGKPMQFNQLWQNGKQNGLINFTITCNEEVRKQANCLDENFYGNPLLRHHRNPNKNKWAATL